MKTLSQAAAGNSPPPDDDDDLINDDNVSVSHLAKLQKAAIEEEAKLE